MGDEEGRLIGFTVRLTEEDHAALKAEAKSKGVELAAYAREILKAHLLKVDFSGNLRDEVISIMESAEFDDIIVEKFLRAMKNKRSE